MGQFGAIPNIPKNGTSGESYCLKSMSYLENTSKMLSCIVLCGESACPIGQLNGICSTREPFFATRKTKSELVLCKPKCFTAELSEAK